MWVAILVYAFDEGGTRAVGFVSILCLVPAGLLAPFAAGLGDRFPRERVVRFGYLTQAVVTGILALALGVGAPPLVVYLVAMVSCIPYTAGRPNHHALLPSLSDAPDEVAAANSVSALTEGVGYAIGGLTAAILATIGAGAIVAVAAAALGLAFVLTLGIHAPSEVDRGSFRAWTLAVDAVDGIRRIATTRGTRILVLIAGALAIATGAIGVLLVPLAIDRLGLGDSGVGFLSTIQSVGLFVGAGVSVALRDPTQTVRRDRRGRRPLRDRRRLVRTVHDHRDRRGGVHRVRRVDHPVGRARAHAPATHDQRRPLDEGLRCGRGVVAAGLRRRRGDRAGVGVADRSAGVVRRARVRDAGRRGRLARRSPADRSRRRRAGAAAPVADRHPDVRAVAAHRPRADRAPTRSDRDPRRHRADPPGRRRRPVLRRGRRRLRDRARRRTDRHRRRRAAISARSRCCTTCRVRRPCARSPTAPSGRWTRRNSSRRSPVCRRPRGLRTRSPPNAVGRMRPTGETRGSLRP